MSDEYRELSVLFHMSPEAKPPSWLDEQAALRRAMPSSIDVGVDTPQGRLFVAMPQGLLVLFERVLRTERKISNAVRGIPLIAQSALIRNLVLDEVVGTNAIEDIQSTRQQVERALEAQLDADTPERRFKELALLYLELSDAQHTIPSSPRDIREIYDKALAGEIPPEKLPDGKLFRAGGVQVTAGGVKVVHTGVEPESKIIEVIEVMLALVGRGDVPQVIAALASHYVFEYAHPFYDGNGRTGRYLLSLFLSDALSTPTVLSLSRSISENRDLYCRAFKSAENPLNRGELTFFVHDMLELVRRAQLELVNRITDGQERFHALTQNMDDFSQARHIAGKDVDLVFTLAQYRLFGSFGSARLSELATAIHLGEQMTRKRLAQLEAAGVVRVTAKRPLRFSLTSEASNALGIADLDE